MSVFIGTSGWQYKSWKHTFYNGSAQSHWLAEYITSFQTVELNNAFYRLPDRSAFEKWHDSTPDDFIMAVKMSRYLTHIKRLHDPEEPVKRFLDRVEPLGSKLGPVLLQLPPNLQINLDALEQTLKLFPRDIRITVEFRHDTWFTDEVRATLEKHNAALCLADTTKRHTPYWRTTDWGYLRFHDGAANPRPCYGRQALHTWAERIAEMWSAHEDVYVYFNNDTNSCAPRDAGVFGHEVERTNRVCSRYPDPKSVVPTVS